MTTSFPLSIQTAYQDLLEGHRTRAVADILGTPFLKKLPQGSYWYARQKIGDKPVDRYLGPDEPDLRKRIEKAKEHQEEKKTFDQRSSSLVAQLRSAGLPAIGRDTGKVLNAMSRVGVFRLGGTLVGTHAFCLYTAELGVRFDAVLAATEDVDVAAFENLKLVIADEVDPSIAKTFKALDLDPVPSLDRKGRPTRWRMKGGGTMVDFLVPRMREENDILFLEPLGVYAQSLSFLNFLIANPIPAVGLYRSGVLVQIPAPERYAIHKLIVAQRRHKSSAAKAVKDLAQAKALIDVLAEDRPGLLEIAYHTAMEMGPKWREAIQKSLKQRPEVKECLSALSCFL